MIDGDSLSDRISDCVSGDYIVFGGVCAVADHDAPVVTVEMISRYGYSLTTNEIYSVVRASKNHIAGEYFSPPTTHIKAVAIIANHIASYGVVIAGVVVYPIRIRNQHIANDTVVLRSGK